MLLFKRFGRRVTALFLAIVACVAVVLAGDRVSSQPVPSAASGDLTEVPFVEVLFGDEVVRLPDFSQITLGSFTVDADGVIENLILPGGSTLDGILGYEFSRIWEAGASLAEVLKVGDVLETFRANDLFPALEGLSLGELDLGDLAGLADAGEFLDDIPLNEIEFLQDLGLEELLEELPGDVAEDLTERFSEIFEASELADETFGSLSNGITVGDVPEIAQIALEEFPGIENFFARTVPFLDRVPLDRILGAVTNLARLDMLYGNHPEGHAYNAVSGPGPRPDPQPPEDCDDGNCPHAEIFFLDRSHGRWVSGAAQEVEGGFGPLMWIGGGVEPTGRMPFGNQFKLVLWDIDEVTDMVETRLFFRVCATIPFAGRTCSPYNLPPQGLPFLPFHRDDYLPA